LSPDFFEGHRSPSRLRPFETATMMPMKWKRDRRTMQFIFLKTACASLGVDAFTSETAMLSRVNSPAPAR